MAQKDGTSSPTDAYTTPETIAYLRVLHTRLLDAQRRLMEFKTVLRNLELHQDYLSGRIQRIEVDRKTAEEHLEQAKRARESVQSLQQFFDRETKQTATLVQHTRGAAQAMFNSLYQLNEKALKRVEAIHALVENKGDTAQDTTEDLPPWTPVFINAISNSKKEGVIAFEAGAKATKDAFNIYVENQKIHVRSLNYLRRLTQFGAELQSVIAFKQYELSLLSEQYLAVLEENRDVEEKASSISKKVEEQSFSVDQLKTEYHAAQLGAESLSPHITSSL